MNLDVTVNALQVVMVAVKALSYCLGLRATGQPTVTFTIKESSTAKRCSRPVSQQ
jgi:hypothetical protein